MLGGERGSGRTAEPDHQQPAHGAARALSMPFEVEPAAAHQIAQPAPCRLARRRRTCAERMARAVVDAGGRGSELHDALGEAARAMAGSVAERAARLTANATKRQVRDIEAACHRLIAVEEMGTLFKAFAISGGSTIVPPAFVECVGFNE